MMFVVCGARGSEEYIGANVRRAEAPQQRSTSNTLLHTFLISCTRLYLHNSKCLPDDPDFNQPLVQIHNLSSLVSVSEIFSPLHSFTRV